LSIEEEFTRAVRAHERGRLAEAERGYLALTRSKPHGANHNLGMLYAATGRLEAAEAALRAAQAADPSSAETREALGLLYLGQGRYAQGWPLFEARREIARNLTPAPDLPFPEWTGQSLQGRRLLLFSEQGAGDVIMFARFAERLREMGAAAVLLVCPPALRPLFRGASVEPLDSTEAADVEADFWSLICSLPLRLGIDLDTTPPPFGFGIATGSGGGVGVVAQGAAGNARDPHRSLFGRDAAQLRRLGRDLSPEATGAGDYLETARIVAGLDLVIAVDTSVAHLAASMGKPTWVLLQARDQDWRWLAERPDSPWYPAVRLFRQRVLDDWTPVLRRVEAQLGKTPVGKAQVGEA
jgi:hypothetical protein